MGNEFNEIDFFNPWLEDLPYDWDELRSHGTVIQLKKGDVLFHQHDKGEYIYMVKKGRVRLYLVSSNGEEKAVSIIGKNGILGECSLNNDSRYSTSAICASDIEVRRISRNEFLAFISKKPEFILQTLDLITKKYRLLCMQSLQLSYIKALPRISGALVQLALKYSEKIDENKFRLTIKFTQQEMANLLGLTRVTISNNIKWLEDREYIFKEGRYYIIPDLQELRELANEH